MSYIETAGAQATGVLPLQHKAYDKQRFDLDFRAHKRCVRIIGRLDTGGNLGHWKYDPETVGDLGLGLCWMQEKGKRPMPVWSFGFGVVVVAQGGSTTRADVASVAAGGPPLGRLPNGGNAQPRSAPNTGTPGGDPFMTRRLAFLTSAAQSNGSGGNSRPPAGQPQPTGGGQTTRRATGPMYVRPVGDPGYGPDMRFVALEIHPWRFVGRANQQGGGPNGPQNGPQGPRGNTLFLGIGAQVHPLGGGFAQFQGVRTNYSSGSARAGAQFTPQTRPGSRGS